MKYITPLLVTLKTYTAPLLVTLALVVGLTIIARTQTAQPTPKVQAWEYKVFVAPVPDSGLELMGSAGWELVTIATVPTENGLKTEYIFKRPK